MNYPNLQAITHEVEFLATSQSSGEISDADSPDYEIHKENNDITNLKQKARCSGENIVASKP